MASEPSNFAGRVRLTKRRPSLGSNMVSRSATSRRMALVAALTAATSMACGGSERPTAPERPPRAPSIPEVILRADTMAHAAFTALCSALIRSSRHNLLNANSQWPRRQREPASATSSLDLNNLMPSPADDFLQSRPTIGSIAGERVAALQGTAVAGDLNLYMHAPASSRVHKPPRNLPERLQSFAGRERELTATPEPARVGAQAKHTERRHYPERDNLE